MMTLSNSRTGSAAAGANTKENPRRKFATGSAGLASVVRGSSRRIMIMRFRPANISLINRRHYLPSASADLVLEVRRQKNNPSDLQILTGSHHINLRVEGDTLRGPSHRYLRPDCRNVLRPTVSLTSKIVRGIEYGRLRGSDYPAR